MWKELPNYNPIAVSSSRSTSQHADNAAALFGAAPEEENAGGEVEGGVIPEVEGDGISGPWSKGEEEDEMEAVSANDPVCTFFFSISTTY